VRLIGSRRPGLYIILLLLNSIEGSRLRWLRMPEEIDAQDHGQFDPDPFKFLIGRQASRCRIGYGSVLFLEFGGNRGEDGNWSLWSDQILWRCEQHGEILAGSEDDRERMEAAAQQINGRTLISGETDCDSGDSVLTFSGGLIIRTFLLTAEENQLWNLSQGGSKAVMPLSGNRQEAEQ
jgi:hypothetical protein